MHHDLSLLPLAMQKNAFWIQRKPPLFWLDIGRTGQTAAYRIRYTHLEPDSELFFTPDPQDCIPMEGSMVDAHFQRLPGKTDVVYRPTRTLPALRIDHAFQVISTSGHRTTGSSGDLLVGIPGQGNTIISAAEFDKAWKLKSQPLDEVLPSIHVSPHQKASVTLATPSCG